MNKLKDFFANLPERKRKRVRMVALVLAAVVMLLILAALFAPKKADANDAQFSAIDLAGVYFDPAVPGRGVFVQQVEVEQIPLIALAVFTYGKVDDAEVPVPVWYTSPWLDARGGVSGVYVFNFKRQIPVDSFPIPNSDGDFFTETITVPSQLQFFRETVVPSPSPDYAEGLVLTSTEFGFQMNTRIDADSTALESVFLLPPLPFPILPDPPPPPIR